MGLNHPFHEDDYGILQPHTMVLFFEIWDDLYNQNIFADLSLRDRDLIQILGFINKDLTNTTWRGSINKIWRISPNKTMEKSWKSNQQNMGSY